MKISPLIVEKGGYARFPGAVLADAKSYDSLTAEINEEDSHITVTSAFSDGNTRRFESDYSFSDDENTLTLTGIQKYWNNAVQ